MESKIESNRKNPLIVIPTYNEIENIVLILRAIVDEATRSGRPVDLLIVDDNSPDGTGAAVRELQLKDEFRHCLHLLERPGKSGLGRAYLAGFNWALENKYEQIVEMDADFSHRPQDLMRILAALSDSDFVVGSRYIDGGSTVNWGLGRKLISRGGSLYSRWILGYPLRDWTGGFNGWNARVLRGIHLANVKSEGYSFQIELKYRALKFGFRGTEVPIVFEDRRVGASKMSSKIVFEAFGRVWSLRFAEL